MSHRFIGGGLAVFACLTLTLMVNLTSLQEGTRELAPPPGLLLQSADYNGAAGQRSADQRLVVLNARRIDKTAAAVHRELSELGYRPGSNDGQMDIKTRAAIMAFEYDNGLPLTAHADAAQLERLLLGLHNTASAVNYAGLPVSPEAKHVMVSVQRSLQQLNYAPGSVNGTYTAATEHAIRRFEVENKLPETGRISGRLIAGLASRTDNAKVKLSRR